MKKYTINGQYINEIFYNPGANLRYYLIATKTKGKGITQKWSGFQVFRFTKPTTASG